MTVVGQHVVALTHVIAVVGHAVGYTTGHVHCWQHADVVVLVHCAVVVAGHAAVVVVGAAHCAATSIAPNNASIAIATLEK